MREEAVVLILCTIALFPLLGLNANASVSINGIHVAEFEAGFSPSYSLEWNKTYGGTGSDFALALVQTTDGGYTLAGNTASFGAGSIDVWLVRTDVFGNMLWNRTYGGTGEDRAYALVQTVDGGYALTGVTYSFGAVNGDAWLVKTDAFGNHLWNKAYGGVSEDVAYALVERVDGGYALLGPTYSYGAGSSDVWLLETDVHGDAKGNQTYGGTSQEYAGSLVQLSDGGYAAAGGTRSLGAGSDDFWLIKTVRDVPIIIVPDDYPTIQEAINNAAEGDTVFVKAGTYYEHVTVNKTIALIGENVDTTVIDGNNTGHVVCIVSNNVSISGFTVQRSGDLEYPYLEAGITLNNSADSTVSGNRLIDNGFYSISLLYSQRSRIAGNVVNRSWGGIHLLSSSNNMVSGNIIENTQGGINGHASSHHNNITENTISNSTRGMFWHAANYNNFCRNNLSAIALEGVWLQDQVNYNLVAENTLINNTVAIRVQGPNYNNTLLRNLITGAEWGIKIENSARYTRIVDNIIVDNRAGNDSWSAGIRLDSGPDSQIDCNTITGNNYGVLLYSSSPRVSIYNNTIASNEFGIRVASGGSSYLNASDNVVMNNRGYGIGLTGFGGGSNNATIAKNLIMNNSDGIALGQYSNYNTITQNNISTNDNGLYIEYSTRNIIYGNNIVDNDQQVNVTYPSANAWDNGYTGGGNHWSDYSGSDQFNGPYQNVTGSDGVGDTPYVIDINNSDRYPSMEPCPTAYHNMAVTGTELSKSVVGQGYSTCISVTVENQGDCAETSNVTIYASEAILAEITHIELRGKTSLTVNFTWNTTGIAYGNYSVRAYVLPVVGETYTEDNAVADAWVLATIPGDVNGDKKVNILDCILVAIHMNHTDGDDHTPGSKEWTDCLNCNINSDTGVNVLDATILSSQFGQSWS